MCLRFVYVLVMGVFSWLRLASRPEAWKDAEILLLRHQLGVLQRQQVRRPRLTWADRALIAALAGVIPTAQRAGSRLLVTQTRWSAGTGTCYAAGGPPSPERVAQVGPLLDVTSAVLSYAWPRRTRPGDTGESTAKEALADSPTAGRNAAT
jgi:hypothetical protein